MLKTNIIGVVNVDLGSLDVFRKGEKPKRTAIPRELLDFPVQEDIETWACRRGFIREGEHVAITG